MKKRKRLPFLKGFKKAFKTQAAKHRHSVIVFVCGALFTLLVTSQPSAASSGVVPSGSPIPISTPLSELPTRLPTRTPTPTVTPRPEPTLTPMSTLNACQEVWQNGTRFEQETGYCLLESHWIPGMVVNRAIWMNMPSLVWGYSAAYAAGMMPDPGPDFLGAVSVPFCIEVGNTVWIKYDGIWEGPYKVEDCSRPVGLWMHVVEYGLVVEVDYETWQRWGGVGAVTLSKSPPETLGDQQPIFIRDWFLAQNPLGDSP